MSLSDADKQNLRRLFEQGYNVAHASRELNLSYGVCYNYSIKIGYKWTKTGPRFKETPVSQNVIIKYPSRKEERNKQIVKLAEENIRMTYDEIAKMFSITKERVRQILKRSGVDTRERLQNRATLTELRKELTTAVEQTVTWWNREPVLRRRLVRPDVSTEELVVDYFDHNMTSTQIGQKYNMTSVAVLRRLQRAGYETRNRGCGQRGRVKVNRR